MTRLQRYTEYLQSEHWASLRQLKFSLSGRKCQCCGILSGLEVHHIRYKDLFDVAPVDLLVICKECHEILHLVVKRKKIRMEEQELAQAMALVDEFRKSDDYGPRKERIKQKRREWQKECEQRNRDRPPKHKLLKGEKKALNKAIQLMQRNPDKIAGLKDVIEFCNGLISKRMYQDNDTLTTTT